MKEVNARLIINHSHDSMGNFIEATCEWIGPKDGMIRMSREVVSQHTPDPNCGDVIKIGNLELAIVDIVYLVDEFWLERLDSDETP